MRTAQRACVLTAAAASVALFAGTASETLGEVVGLWTFEEFTSTTYGTNNGPYQNFAPPSSMVSVTNLQRATGTLEANTTRDNGTSLPSWMVLVGAGSLDGTNDDPLRSPAFDSGNPFQFSITALQDGVQFTEFSVDLAVSASASGVATLTNEMKARLFYSTDGGTNFTAIGSEPHLITNSDTLWTGIQNHSVDLSSITLNSGETAIFRLALTSNRGSASTSLGYYLDNFSIAAVPEPASLSLLGMAGLGLIRRRRA